MSRTALVFDQGIFVHVAESLTQGFDEVLYYSPWREAFPLSRRVLPGEGLPNVTRVNHFYEHIDDADVIIFPDVGRGDMQLWLREHGKRVWGSAGSEILELDRLGFHRLLKAKGLPVVPTEELDGLDALQAFLEDPKHTERYVKISEFRGDFETHHHVDWWLTQPWFDKMRHQLGPMGNRITFAVEEHIDGVEVGYDGWCIDGAYAPIAMYGYEYKDTAYIGKVVAHKQLPSVLLDTLEKMSMPLAQMGCRSLFSTELRVTPEGEGYFIDPTMRWPSPPGESLMNAFSNWPDIVYDGADGDIVLPKPTCQYAAQLMLSSDWAKTDFLSVRFPEDHRDHIKLRGHAIIDDTDYVIVTGMDMETFGAAVGTGDTMEEAIDMATEVAKSVEGYRVSYDAAAFDKIKDQIDEGVEYGIPWD